MQVAPYERPALSKGYLLAKGTYMASIIFSFASSKFVCNFKLTVMYFLLFLPKINYWSMFWVWWQNQALVCGCEAEPARLPAFHTCVGVGEQSHPAKWFQEKGNSSSLPSYAARWLQRFGKLKEAHPSTSYACRDRVGFGNSRYTSKC